MRGTGRAAFAATLLVFVGFMNVIYGIGALDNANIFVNDERFVFEDLNAMGWVLIVLGTIQLTGGFSLFAGNTYGRVIGIAGAGLGAVAALFSIGGNNPWWSLAIFALCIYVLSGLIEFGSDVKAADDVYARSDGRAEPPSDGRAEAPSAGRAEVYKG
jgi:hypothetical protein